MENRLLDVLLGRFLSARRLFKPFGEQPFDLYIVVNPAAGRLRKRKPLRTMIADFDTVFQAEGNIPSFRPAEEYVQIEADGNRTVVIVPSSRDALSPLADKAAEAIRTSSSRSLLISVGGDGFHKDIGAFLIEKHPEILDRLVMLRLPCGTGNDSADTADFRQALALLAGTGVIKERGIIEVHYADGSVDRALNVCSFGIDAFVCSVVNRVKRKLRGDIFRIISDIAVLFYDVLYPAQEFILKVTCVDGTTVSYQGKNTLTVMGTSGHTDYGGHKPVLPGDETLCYAPLLSLGQKLKLKGRLYRGTHYTLPEFKFLPAREVTVEYPGNLLIELDGEPRLLTAADFPVRLTIRENAFRVLRFL